MIDKNREPSPRDLRVFGLLLIGFSCVVGGLIYWRLEAPRAAVGVASGGLLVALLYHALPPIRRFVYLGWMKVTYPIGWTVSHLALAAVFYLVVTPIGLIMRLFGRDPMQRRRSPKATTYWAPRASGVDTARIFRQF
jgi:Saxitoxin biosynthesis operon protein SxtJ